MNLGLHDAIALAEALSLSLKNGDMKPLDTYALTRRAAAADILRMTDRLTLVATLKHRPLRVLRNILIGTASRFAFIRRKLTRTLAGTE